MVGKFLRGLALSVSVCLLASAATAQQIKIVALGHSAFVSQAVPTKEDYPAQLQGALRARGYDVEVSNAGVWGDTTSGVLRRLDKAVPDGTRIVLLHIGANDRSHGRPQSEVDQNIGTIIMRIRAKGARVIQFRDAPPPAGVAYPMVEVWPDRVIIPGIRFRTPEEYRMNGGPLLGAGSKAVVERTLPVVEELIAELQDGS